MLAVLGYVLLILVLIFVALKLARTVFNKSLLYFLWFLSVCVLVISSAVLFTGDFFRTSVDKLTTVEAKEKTLKIGVVNNTLPYLVVEDNNGVLGIEASLIDAIATKAGYNVIYVNIKETNPFEALSLGMVDILAGDLTLDFIKDKESLFATQNYLQAKIVALTTKSQISQYSNLDDLLNQVQDKTVAVDTTLTNFNTTMKDDLIKSKALIQTYDKPVDLLNDLNSNQIDIAFTSDLSWQFYKSYNQNNSLTLIKFDTLPQQLQTYDIVMVSSNQEVVSKLNDSINELKSDHKLDDIVQKYLNGTP